MDPTHYYFNTCSLLPSSSHSSRGFCCLFRHRGSSQDVVFVLWLETKNGNMTFVNKAELKYQWHKSIYPRYHSTDLKAYFGFRRNITFWCFANHKNLGIENTKVRSENIQNNIPDWKDACESCNIIILISKLLLLVVCFLIPGPVSVSFASWRKDRIFPLFLNHAVIFVPAKDLWHLSRFDSSISQNQHFQWKLFNYTNKIVLSKPLMEVEQLYFQLFPSTSPLTLLWCQSQRWKLHSEQASNTFSRNYSPIISFAYRDNLVI